MVKSFAFNDTNKNLKIVNCYKFKKVTSTGDKETSFQAENFIYYM